MARHLAHVSLLGKIAACTESLARNPASTAFIPLSDAYRQMGMIEEALDVVRQGIAAMPYCSPGFTMLGRLLVETGEPVEAMEMFEKALELEADNVPALKGLARLCFRQGDRMRARTLLQRAAALKPDDQTVTRLLSTLGSASAPDPLPAPPSPSAAADPIATPTIAEIYLRQGLPDRALQVYRDLLRADPTNGDLCRRLEALEDKIQADERALQAEESGLEAVAQAFRDPLERRKRQVEVLARWADAARRRRRHVQ